MLAAQGATTPSRPWHLWVIGIVGGLWSSIGAFRVLVASLIGAMVSNLGGLFVLGGMEVMRETGGLGLTVFPLVFAALLAYYARAMSKKGVLGMVGGKR